ncbi:MAG: hypothetical protein Q7S84_02330 [bacterium]|nr:hypothetical protein [bacterium]
MMETRSYQYTEFEVWLYAAGAFGLGVAAVITASSALALYLIGASHLRVSTSYRGVMREASHALARETGGYVGESADASGKENEWANQVLRNI